MKKNVFNVLLLITLTTTIYHNSTAMLRNARRTVVRVAQPALAGAAAATTPAQARITPAYSLAPQPHRQLATEVAELATSYSDIAISAYWSTLLARSSILYFLKIKFNYYKESPIDKALKSKSEVNEVTQVQIHKKLSRLIKNKTTREEIKKWPIYLIDFGKAPFAAYAAGGMFIINDIVLNDLLNDSLKKRKAVAAIFLHELAHRNNNDIVKTSLVRTASPLLIHSILTLAGIDLLTIVSTIPMAVVLGMGANEISRICIDLPYHRLKEYQADKAVKQEPHLAEAMAFYFSEMQSNVLKELNKKALAGEKLTLHERMYLSKSLSPLLRLTGTHPPITSRIEYLSAWAKTHKREKMK